MSKKTTRIICIVLAVLMLLGVIAAAIPAFAVTQAEIDALQEERDRIKSEQADIQEEIDTLKSEMASVMDRKAALDHQIDLTQQDIELLDSQIALYDEMIAEKGREVEEAVEAEETQLERYKARVRTMEESNTWTYISILLKATSLTDFLGRLSDVSDIIRNDQNVREEYIAAREYVEQVKADYEEIQSEQLVKREELGQKQELLEEQTVQAQNLIKQLEDDIEAYEISLDEKDAAREDIQAQIDAKVAELQKQQEEERKAREAYEAALREQQRQQQLQQQQQQQQSGSSGAPSGAGTLLWPVNNYNITSPFGWRIHPLTGVEKYHAGVDIGAYSGYTISAAAGGTVQISEYSSSYGNYCVIYHSSGMTTLYAHMNSLPVVKVGDTVTAGVGSTGWANGPHLHFEVRVNGTNVDPLSYFPNTSFNKYY